MAANIWRTGTSNAFSTTLNGGITDNATTIALTSVTGLQAPGVVVVDRTDSNNTATPVVREFISFTGISGSSLTGCTRGLGGSTAQAHSSGAKVEQTWSITNWNDFLDAFAVSHDTSGNIVSTSTATLSTIRLLTHLNASGASLSFEKVAVTNHLYASGASVSGRGLGLWPTWVMANNASAATTSIGKPTAMPTDGTIRFVSVTLRVPLSGASGIWDVNKNFSSVFDAGTRPTILGGGTFVSTASIATQDFKSGDIFSVDLDAGGSYSDAVLTMGAY